MRPKRFHSAVLVSDDLLNATQVSDLVNNTVKNPSGAMRHFVNNFDNLLSLLKNNLCRQMYNSNESQSQHNRGTLAFTEKAALQLYCIQYDIAGYWGRGHISISRSGRVSVQPLQEVLRQPYQKHYSTCNNKVKSYPVPVSIITGGIWPAIFTVSLPVQNNNQKTTIIFHTTPTTTRNRNQTTYLQTCVISK